jgi:hypothetical protein
MGDPPNWSYLDSVGRGGNSQTLYPTGEMSEVVLVWHFSRRFLRSQHGAQFHARFSNSWRALPVDPNMVTWQPMARWPWGRPRQPGSSIRTTEKKHGCRDRFAILSDCTTARNTATAAGIGRSQDQGGFLRRVAFKGPLGTVRSVPSGKRSSPIRRIDEWWAANTLVAYRSESSQFLLAPTAGQLREGGD